MDVAHGSSGKSGLCRGAPRRGVASVGMRRCSVLNCFDEAALLAGGLLGRIRRWLGSHSTRICQLEPCCDTVTLNVAYLSILCDALIFARLVGGMFLDQPVPNLCKIFEGLAKTPGTAAFAQVT